ncbi:unnamed protein product [Paramecium pentaurelia]|uniref:Uncharacterized protein n=1 Tax=Paramecium pentaurelia TaxID=43138 RepID=A0A8S1T6X4_9CILI|nr:unnamed protein product [Paramecium pentaurelia]
MESELTGTNHKAVQGCDLIIMGRNPFNSNQLNHKNPKYKWKGFSKKLRINLMICFNHLIKKLNKGSFIQIGLSSKQFAKYSKKPKVLYFAIYGALSIVQILLITLSQFIPSLKQDFYLVMLLHLHSY